ncbi:MAG: 23S rRNA (uridine(2552)-2'-O)-methyltransferase RlmE [Gammaproteobacteria bacterium]|nr:23S rRNA (uridine(2552)-2'-O)-methyltransferase RlmE [Gammaproteobacteria bacterium]
MKSHKSKQRWLNEHHNDDYVKRARKEGYRSRAVYKLLEIDDRDRILKPGMTVIDLGAAPGGWSQVAAIRLQGKGRIIASDILPMDPLAGVEIVEGDFREQAVFDRIMALLGDAKADLVISDMAPNISGVAAIDQPRAMFLTELALDLALKILKPGGNLLVKVFQGAGSDDYIRLLRQHFKVVTVRKPKASRPRSREVYALSRDLIS